MTHKLAYHPKLYLGGSINRKKLEKIKKRLGKRFFGPDVFLVTLSRNNFDQLELYGAKELAHSYYRKNPPFVVGIAGNRDEAVEVVKIIVEECLRERGDCAIKEYLRC